MPEHTRQLHSQHAVMLGMLDLKTLQNIGRDMPVLAEDNTVSTYRSARVAAHSLIAAADALGFRTQRGKWWPPG